MHRSDFLTLALALLILWLPLPFGSVVPWAHDVVRISAFGLLLVAALLVRGAGGLRRAAIPAASVAFIGLIGVLQSLEWPRALVALLSPEHVRLALDANPEPNGVALSLAPAMSFDTGLSWLAVAACAVVAAMIGDRSRRRRWLGLAVCLAAMFQVLYGARHWMSHSTSIWGVEAGRSMDRLRGTFVNPDHLALYLEITLALVLAWLWWAVSRLHRSQPLDRRVAMVTPPALLWLTCFAALAFTGSRAGLAAAVAATSAQGLLVAARKRRWRLGAVGVIAPLLGLFLVAAIGLQAGLGRWLATSQADLTWNGRLAVYRASLELWAQFKALGTGLGSFREAFPMVQPDSIMRAYRHAHNDFLEVLVTTGVLGAVVLIIGVVALLAGLARVLLLAERSEQAAAGLAALGACVAVMMHSLLDFGLTMPANAATLAIVCGAALAVPVATRTK